MKYVLDRWVIGAVLKGEIVPRTRLSLCHKSEVVVPPLVVAHFATELARRGRPANDSIRIRFDLIRAEILRAPWTDSVTERFAALKSERGNEFADDVDLAVAAHALALGGIVVTTGSVERFAGLPDVRSEKW